MRHYPDLDSASDWMKQIFNQSKLLTQIWEVACHQYGVSALVSQTSFGGETSGSVAKCWLFSQAILAAVQQKDSTPESEKAAEIERPRNI